MNQPPDTPRKFGRQDCVVRLLHTGDEPRLQEFFHSHTPDTIYERYGCLVSTMTAERAASLVNVDQTRDCALGIFAAPPAEEILLEGKKMTARKLCEQLGWKIIETTD